MVRRALVAMLGFVFACQAETEGGPPAATAGHSASGNAGAAAGTPSSGAGGSLSMGGAGMSGGGASGAGATSGPAGEGGTAGASANGAAGSGGASGGVGGANEPELPRRVLLYHFSTLKIDSLAAQLTLLGDQLEAWGYEVEQSVDPIDLGADSLERFAAVAMINTCFEPFGQGQPGTNETTALKGFVERGGGLFGTHCAAVTFQSAEPPHPYNALIGGRGGDGYFDGQSACRSTAQHDTTSALPATFEYQGNLDNADYLAPDSTVLVRCSWSGGDKKDVAVSWYRTPGKGRVFYTNFAKEDADLKSSLGTQHVLPGLAWVLRR